MLLLGCSPEVSSQEQEIRCTAEMRRFHKAEICYYLEKFRKNQFREPTVEEAAQGANIQAKRLRTSIRGGHAQNIERSLLLTFSRWHLNAEDRSEAL